MNKKKTTTGWEKSSIHIILLQFPLLLVNQLFSCMKSKALDENQTHYHIILLLHTHTHTTKNRKERILSLTWCKIKSHTDVFKHGTLAYIYMSRNDTPKPSSLEHLSTLEQIPQWSMTDFNRILYLSPLSSEKEEEDKEKGW